MTPKILILVTLMACIFMSCNENNLPEEKIPEVVTFKKELLEGVVQKGPFLNGTSIIVSELDSNLVQTGRTFSTQINSNNGSFELKGIVLLSPYVEIKADGFYFNEVTGANSNERLILYAIADVSNQNTLNVNVLSTLEKFRIIQLREQGISFKEAKKQAQQEVLGVFELQKTNMINSELLTISESGEDNAILLAASVILQGKRTVAEISELISNIAFDLKDNGKLDNNAYGTQLINDAMNLDLQKVRSNMESRYDQLTTSFAIPDFESRISHFKQTTRFEFTNKITYPANGEKGLNILALTDGVQLPCNMDLSLKAVIPDDMTVKVVYKNTKSSSGSHTGWLIGYGISDIVSNWNSSRNSAGDRIEWNVKPGSKEADCAIFFEGVSYGVFEIYENGATSPTRVINIWFGITDLNRITYPAVGKHGPNILSMENNTLLEKGKSYSIAANIPPMTVFMYGVGLLQKSGAGSMVVNKTLSTGWDAVDVFETKKTLRMTCLEGNKQTDIPIQFAGEGES